MNNISTQSLKMVTLPFVRRRLNRYDLTIEDFEIKINKTLFPLDYAYGVMDGYFTAYNLVSYMPEASRLLYETSLALLRRAETHIIINSNSIKI